ncbi:hypothetical protein FRUB_02396 [Fimbriiglobus ruber]|uniref:Uncharacterized protein n=1 Tax=Fimbriiglobus ruber TaxID=1908690 RepID=A0A225DY13_9BACT|nr:hypothetical protein FRUB_02396 [Fimbriiglobus ruber]
MCRECEREEPGEPEPWARAPVSSCGRSAGSGACGDRIRAFRHQGHVLSGTGDTPGIL